MSEILKKYPVPIVGLILGLAATGNLVQSHGEVYHNIFGVISTILLILMIVKIVKYPNGISESLDNPIIASVLPTFSMAIMVLSTYLKLHAELLAYTIWVIGVALHIILIVWFTKKFVFSFKIKQVYPSWFIVYIGIVAASVTGPTFKMVNVGQIVFWFGFVTYLILLPMVIYRVIIVKEMAEQTLPTLSIFSAPASILLAGYMNSFKTKNIVIVCFLITLSIIMYVAAIIMLFKLLRLKFYPSYSAFTFPFVISGIGMKLTNGFLIKSGQNIAILKYFVGFQEVIGVILTLYVLIRYIEFLLPENSTILDSKSYVE